MTKIAPEERRTARRAAFNVAGVDILRSNHGQVVIAVDSFSGREGHRRPDYRVSPEVYVVKVVGTVGVLC